MKPVVNAVFYCVQLSNKRRPQISAALEEHHGAHSSKYGFKKQYIIHVVLNQLCSSL